MFGFRDEFRYQECSSCGSLQISDIPEDITKYYPSYYVAFTQQIPQLKLLPFFKRLFKQNRLQRRYKRDLISLRHVKPANSKINDRILDVGCGKGQLICELFNEGFENVEGVDKFLPEEIDHGFNVKVKKKELKDLDSNSYDLVMMHHVLEHIDQQEEALTDCFRLLKDKGCLLIRIPVIGAAWERYQRNWVQLDAPRHFFLHTLKSMEILAEKCGFEIRHTIFDSNSFQMWGSELYVRDIPLTVAEDGYQPVVLDNFFSKEQMKAFEHEAEQLNLESKGDAAAFYLYKK